MAKDWWTAAFHEVSLFISLLLSPFHLLWKGLGTEVENSLEFVSGTVHIYLFIYSSYLDLIEG